MNSSQNSVLSLIFCCGHIGGGTFMIQLLGSLFGLSSCLVLAANMAVQ
jgi:hypothetical protein